MVPRRALVSTVRSGRTGFSGSVLTVKCTAASSESPTRAVYRMPVPLNASSRICCMASRQAVV